MSIHFNDGPETYVCDVSECEHRHTDGDGTGTH